MLSRSAVMLALAGALFTLSLSPSRADTASDIKALQSAVSTLQSQVKTLQTTVTSQQAQINTLKSITSGFSRVTDTTRTDGKKGTELFLTGFNLHVVNGLGATNGVPSNPADYTNPVLNGLGNVIIGYNQTRANTSYGADARTGSHNLVVGDGENYTSFGGVVFGAENTTDGPYASVTGGVENIASGYTASVTAGVSNTASGNYCGVDGGIYNTAGGYYSSIGGGYQNTTSGFYSSVSAGKRNMASGDYSAVSGGQFNTVSSDFAIIGGGLNVLETTSSGFAAGGQYSGTDPGPGVFHSP